jgi:catechol 2,3-dioxygenase-like lactoylglutathione lyase family enzyme
VAALMFSRPQINIYSDDIERSREFYLGLGFEETFRTPSEGTPVHVELVLDGFKLGIAAATSVVSMHGLDVDLGRAGRGIEIALWTYDVDEAFSRLVAAGATPLSEPHEWLHLRGAWLADPDGNPIQLVQRRS